MAQSSALADDDAAVSRPAKVEPIKLAFSYTWWTIRSLFHLLRPSTMRNGYSQLRQMTLKDLIKSFYSFLVKFLQLIFLIFIYAFR